MESSIRSYVHVRYGYAGIEVTVSSAAWVRQHAFIALSADLQLPCDGCHIAAEPHNVHKSYGVGVLGSI